MPGEPTISRIRALEQEVGQMRRLVERLVAREAGDHGDALRIALVREKAGVGGSGQAGDFTECEMLRSRADNAEQGSNNVVLEPIPAMPTIEVYQTDAETEWAIRWHGSQHWTYLRPGGLGLFEATQDYTAPTNGALGDFPARRLDELMSPVGDPIAITDFMGFSVKQGARGVYARLYGINWHLMSSCPT